MRPNKLVGTLLADWFFGGNPNCSWIMSIGNAMCDDVSVEALSMLNRVSDYQQNHGFQ